MSSSQRIVVGWAVVLLAIGVVMAQEAGDSKTPEGIAASPTRAELEKKFVETLTNATLLGRWRLVANGKLGEEKEEKYVISGISKLPGGIWLIFARIQYGDKDVTVPVPVRVEWAGDTPVVSVTNAGLEGLGTYSARVLFYDNLYAGTWAGKGYGGLLSGSITRESTGAKSKKPGDN